MFSMRSAGKAGSSWGGKKEIVQYKTLPLYQLIQLQALHQSRPTSVTVLLSEVLKIKSLNFWLLVAISAGWSGWKNEGKKIS